MKSRNWQIKGSTLIEVIIAMLIASITFFMTYTIILNTIGVNKMMKYYQANSVCNYHYRKMMNERKIETGTFEEGEYILKQDIITNYNNFGIKKITITVTNKSGVLLAEVKFILRDGQPN